MATTVHKPARFELTQRIRTEKKYSRDLETRLALIDRIAELPGIETVERNIDAVPCRVDVYLKRDSTRSLRERQAAPLFCSLSRDGIAICGLDEWARHKVISRGWGRLDFNQVLVFLPRDHRELEVVWKILQRAYDNLFDPSAKVPGAHIVSTWDWPKFSRTTLQ